MTFWKSLVCVEAAALLYALGVVGFFFVATLLGIAGARAQGISPPPLGGEKLLELLVVLAVCVGLTSLPSAAVLGLIASRVHEGRLFKILVAGGACLLVQAMTAAYPMAAFSPYLFSNVPPAAPFPWGADWHPSAAMLRLFLWGVLFLGTPFLGALFAGAILRLERWARPV